LFYCRIFAVGNSFLFPETFGKTPARYRLLPAPPASGFAGDKADRGF
jgi:hypothetical protein